MKLYGSLNNRFDENHYFNGTLNNIKVGTLCTIYSWSDRHAYEVIEVEDQENITIRQLKAIRTDNYGMSDAQNYRYESDPSAKPERIRLTKNGWMSVSTFNKEGFEQCTRNLLQDCKNEEAARKLATFYWRQNLTEKQFEKVMAGKTVTKNPRQGEHLLRDRRRILRLFLLRDKRNQGQKNREKGLGEAPENGAFHLVLKK